MKKLWITLVAVVLGAAVIEIVLLRRHADQELRVREEMVISLNNRVKKLESENEWLGETKDAVMERAQDVATQVRQAAGDIAGQVASEVVSGRQEESR